MTKRIIGAVVFACALLFMLFGAATLFFSTGTQAGAPSGVASSTLSHSAANAAPQAPRPAATGVWTDTAPFPTITLSPTPGSFPLKLKRAGAAAYPPNGKIYVMGGRHGTDGEDTTLQWIWEYTPGNPGTWLRKTALLDGTSPGDRFTANMAVAVLTDSTGVRVYAIGGSSIDSVPSASVRSYDPVADSVTVLTADAWPAAPAHVPGGYAVYNNKLYIFGGFSAQGTGSVFADTWRFDPMAASGQKWTQLTSANLGLARGYMAGAALDGKIYAIGGDTWISGTRTLSPVVNVERMDPSAGSPTWTAMAGLPTARGDMGAWAYDSSTNYEITGRIAIAGGMYPTPDALGYLYNPNTNTWSSWGSLAHATRNYGVAQLNGFLYALGGYDYTNNTPIGANFNQRYDATTPIGSPTPTFTGTPPTATRTFTASPASNTPTATATVCGRVDFVSTDVPKTICDQCTITSTLQVAGVGTIGHITVRNLDISHTFIGDLIVTLTSPGGTTVTLFNRQCGSSQNIPGIHYDDTGSGPIACPPTAGATYQPDSPLSALNGQNANGRWVLTVSDNAAIDSGTLNAWGLRFTVTNCTTGTPAASATATLTPSASPTSICPPLTTDVTIQSFAFAPSPLTVYQGTTVRWTNLDAVNHSSTSDTALWDSGLLGTSQTYSRRFDTVGTFAYHCSVHPSMTASVIVLAGCPPTVTPTVTATRPPANTNTPTGTSQPALTNTPTAPAVTTTAVTTATRTATACTISFSDVHASDFFYQGVGWLYCRGAISGYGDNTFRPFNNTTRGQMVKIVTLAYGIPTYTPTTPTFNDVPATDPFYSYVETAAHSNIVSGYTCGGPGEPCPGNYFRPGALVTRGQLSKIVVVAAGWGLLNPTNATFTDVARNSAFYTYIETAYCHQVISGYTCGGPGEPCPGKYFRPDNNATRGQIAKMVYNAVSNLPCDSNGGN